MYNVIKSYNREYYYKLIRIHLSLWFDLSRMYIVKLLFHLAYRIDADLCRKITGRELK